MLFLFLGRRTALPEAWFAHTLDSSRGSLTSNVLIVRLMIEILPYLKDPNTNYGVFITMGNAGSISSTLSGVKNRPPKLLLSHQTRVT